MRLQQGDGFVDDVQFLQNVAAASRRGDGLIIVLQADQPGREEGQRREFCQLFLTDSGMMTPQGAAFRQMRLKSSCIF